MLPWQAKLDCRSCEGRIPPDFVGPDGEPIEHVDLAHVRPRLLTIAGSPAVPVQALSAPPWNSVALFFNLAGAAPAGYQATTPEDALNWLDEGTAPAAMSVSEFMCNYWRTVSHGQLAFGIDTPRGSDGKPLVPTVTAPANDWIQLIKDCIAANADAAWLAAGSPLVGQVRQIPSVVLVQHYPAGAAATDGNFDVQVGGQQYHVQYLICIEYSLDLDNRPNLPPQKGRRFWAVLVHEYAHNFLHFGDLYSPQGCTGYWDVLGQNSPAGCMSEVSSLLKTSVGWTAFKEEIQGPVVAARDCELQPYTTSGEAFKVVPDPGHNPLEYFLLEYRKSTGTELWRPDGGLPEEGLLIQHINARLGLSPLFLLHDAPFYDPEFADYSDGGGALWTGYDRLRGILFPQGTADAFTPQTAPSSNFYGGRPSGLSITKIRVENGVCTFRIKVQASPRIGWTPSRLDRGVSGRFLPGSAGSGAQLFLHDQHDAALLVHREAQWLVAWRRQDWLGEGGLGGPGRDAVGDFDGDGTDELLLRSPSGIAFAKWVGSGFRILAAQDERVDGWALRWGDRERVADLDGDGRAEVYVRDASRVAVVELAQGGVRTVSLQSGQIGQWSLSASDQEIVGRFTRGTADQILVRNPQSWGLLSWDPGQQQLKVDSLQAGSIDQWPIEPLDELVAGDFDGDGLDEVYVRKAARAALLKWRYGRFQLLWTRANDIQPTSDPPWGSRGIATAPLALHPDDASYAGRFLLDRDGVLHRFADGLAVLAWEGQEMRVHFFAPPSLLSPLQLSRRDRLVLGDYHRRGLDVGSASDTVADQLTDVFVHDETRTAMVAVNYAYGRQEIGATWLQAKELLLAS